MSFLNNLFQDPKYQNNDPRKPEEIDDQEIIISPDTRREKRIPPGQSRTKKWPVLDAHGTPDIDLATWTFEVEGLVENRLQWSLDEFMQLPAVRVYADFSLRDALVASRQRLERCIGTREIARLAGVKPEAKFVLALAYDYGWTTNVPIEYFLNEDSLFAWSHDGQPIAPEHGGPVRPDHPTALRVEVGEVDKGRALPRRRSSRLLGRRRLPHARRALGPGDGERFRWS
jgi:DMSO/TMAO reductase YedYZ molybdopterin-dependent catalytic subunit